MVSLSNYSAERSMTIVAAFQMAHTSLLVADCRLTWKAPLSASIYQDVCQKIFVLDPEVIVGFSGDLDYAVVAVERLEQRIRESGVDWLSNVDQVLTWASKVPSPRRAAYPTVLVVSFVDHRCRLSGLPGIVQSFAISLNPPRLFPSGLFDLGVFGCGAEPVSQVLSELNAKHAVNEFTQPADGTMLKLELGAMMAVECVSSALARFPEPSVGGLLQAVVLSPLVGAFAVPYEQWVDVNESCGTYVRMDIQEGAWIQSHHGAEQKVINPVIERTESARAHMNKIFEARGRLKPDDDGVVATPGPFLRKYGRLPTRHLAQRPTAFGLARRRKRVRRPARMLTGADRLWLQTKDGKLHSIELPGSEREAA
jgi:hypothetical protein